MGDFADALHRGLRGLGGSLNLAAIFWRGGEQQFVVVAARKRELVHDVFGQGLAQRGQGGHGVGKQLRAGVGCGKYMPEVLGEPIGDVLGGGGEGENGLPEGNARGRVQAGGFALGKQVFR